MKDVITEYLVGPGKGIITTAESRQLGCSPSVLRGMVRAKSVVQVARGAYVSAALMNPPKDSPLRRDPYAFVEHCHTLRLDALLRLLGTRAAASHQSAVLAWGLPTESTSLDRIHLVHTVRGRTARRRDVFTLHTCELDEVIVRHRGRRLVIPSLAVIGQALIVGRVAGVIAMDAAIRSGLTSPGELQEMLTRMRHTPRLGIARLAVAQADGLAESPGETRLRLILIELGVCFIAQHWVRTGTDGHYRVDFYLPELGVILEYDGKVKYGGPSTGGVGSRRSPDATAAVARRALMDEKRREDDLRLEGFGVGRVTLRDLNAHRVAAIIGACRKQAQPKARHRSAERPAWATTPNS